MGAAVQARVDRKRNVCAGFAGVHDQTEGHKQASTRARQGQILPTDDLGNADMGVWKIYLFYRLGVCVSLVHAKYVLAH